MAPVLRRIDVGGLTLALQVWQPSPHTQGAPTTPVLLLPGTGATAEDWDAIAEELSRTRTVYALDLRGHGESDWPGTYSLALMADDVTRLLDRLPEAAVDAVGHSLGGLVACLTAVQRPEAIRRLVLEDVGIPHPRPPATPARPDEVLPFDWSVVEQVRPEIDDPDPMWPDRVRGIRAPTLVIAGGATSFVPQEHIRELVAALPDGRMETVPVGHLVHETAPEQFLTHLTAFLDG